MGRGSDVKQPVEHRVRVAAEPMPDPRGMRPQSRRQLFIPRVRDSEVSFASSAVAEPVLPNRLRAPRMAQPFHVLLVEPEIPPNTGNIARLCAATCCPLHLVGKLGFSIDEHAVRRAGLDYWPLVELYTHATLEDAETAVRGLAAAVEPRFWLFSGRAARSYLDVAFRFGDALVFGKESIGLPEALLESRIESVVGIPTLGEVRSLNLASAAAVAVYEALRQTGALVTEHATASST